MKIVFGGDFMPMGKWEKIIQNNSGNIYTDKVLDFLSDSEIRNLNLEAPLTISNDSIRKHGPNLKSKPLAIEAIKTGGFNLISLANNHIWDYGKQGLEDTIGVLNENGLEFIGVGENKVSSSKNIYKKNNVIFINCGYHEWGVSTDTNAGYYGYDLVSLCNQIEKYKENYYICLIIHGGHELFSYPSPKMKKEFRFLIDFGANLIITHHSHYATGFEKYKNGMIFYGLGNLLFEGNSKDENWHESFLLKVDIIDRELKDYEILPIENHVEDGQIQNLKGKKLIEFRKKLANYNRIIKSDEMLLREWNKHISIMKISYMVGVKGYNKYLISLANRFSLFEKFLFKENKNLFRYKNYFNNQAHNEIINSILNSRK